MQNKLGHQQNKIKWSNLCDSPPVIDGKLSKSNGSLRETIRELKMKVQHIAAC